MIAGLTRLLHNQAVNLSRVTLSPVAGNAVELVNAASDNSQMFATGLKTK